MAQCHPQVSPAGEFSLPAAGIKAAGSGELPGELSPAMQQWRWGNGTPSVQGSSWAERQEVLHLVRAHEQQCRGAVASAPCLHGLGPQAATSHFHTEEARRQQTRGRCRAVLPASAVGRSAV